MRRPEVHPLKAVAYAEHVSAVGGGGDPVLAEDDAAGRCALQAPTTQAEPADSGAFVNL